jgi:hypothetical protein
MEENTMRMKLVAASLLALGMATSMSYAQSNPVPNKMATDKNANEDAGGGAGTNGSSGTKTMKPMGTDTTTTNSTSGGISKSGNPENCKSKSGSGSVQTQAGNSGTLSTEDTCADNNN